VKYLSCFVFLPVLAWGQLEVVPIGKVKHSAHPGTLPARITSLPPMNLPFWDDFSTATASDTLWESRETVWINPGMAIAPPTIHVASFDGLNAEGIPYNTVLPQETGFTDSLVSRKINLAAVPPAQRNRIFLSFFFQWGGFADTPDPSDYLTLELKNNDGIWEPAITLYGSGGYEEGVFYDTAVRIHQERFYTNDFQFRFRSFGRRSGRYDVWNIDYVYLNVRTPSEEGTSISDRAMTRPFSSLFSPYHAIPYAHFRENPGAHLRPPTFEVFNLKDTSFAQVLNYSSYYRITNFTAGVGTTTFDSFVDFEAGIAPVPSRGRAQYTASGLPPATAFHLSADSALIWGKISINSGDNDEDYFARYQPIDFRVNDTLYQHFVLSNYYAYDDGTAEYAAGLTQAGNMAAYKFYTVHGQPDTLVGGWIHYPWTAANSPSIATLLIWNSRNGKPDGIIAEQVIPVRREGNHVFTPFTLSPAIIVPDTFFVGWRQGPGNLIRIGLDSSNDTGDRMYVNTNGTWVLNDLVRGSLMIRPRFGKGDVVTAVEKPAERPPALYPNPTRGKFYLEGNLQDLGIFSLMGQPLLFTASPVTEDRIEVHLHNPIPGMIVVRYRKDQQVHVLKVLVSP
jgi:hypothetical protein